jgi:Fe2+ or Zn2+ uptake regulation protein
LINILDEKDGFVDVATLRATAKQKGARIDRATVYRTLALLRANDLLAPATGAANGPERAHGAAPVAHDELRLTCERCGGRQPIPADTPDSIKREIRRCIGFQARAVRLEASGECRLCAAKLRLRNRSQPRPILEH